MNDIPITMVVTLVVCVLIFGGILLVSAFLRAWRDNKCLAKDHYGRPIYIGTLVDQVDVTLSPKPYVVTGIENGLLIIEDWWGTNKSHIESNNLEAVGWRAI